MKHFMNAYKKTRIRTKNYDKEYVLKLLDPCDDEVVDTGAGIVPETGWRLI